MSGPVRVVVAVPARDEGELIAGCLRSLDRCIRQLRRHCVVGDVLVVVAAHRCVDDTASVALRTLQELKTRGEVLIDDEATSVGAVRDRAVRRGLELVGGARQTWVFSTDADTVVRPDWISRALAVAAEFDAACVVGLAALDRWRGSNAALHAYRDLLERKLQRESAGDEHRHVYGANLAVRADAYAAVGGFACVAHGEDHRLVATLEAAGYRIARTCQVTVTTSGRLHGRAPGGLADRLRLLHAGHPPELGSHDVSDAANVGI